MLKRLPHVFAAFLTLAVLSLASIHTAQAQTQMCAQSGSGYCLNDWNNGGYGNQVKMYSGGASNENFVAQHVNRCSGHDYVTSTCPGSSSFDSAHLGDPIYQIRYQPNGDCVADLNGSGVAYLG